MKIINVATRMIIYDFSYAAGDFLFKSFAPCKIYKHPTTAQLTCYVRDLPTIYEGGQCCSGCQYTSHTGCTVHCLMCKLWMCHNIYSSELYDPLHYRLNVYYAVANKLNLLGIRKPRGYIRDNLVRCHLAQKSHNERS